MSRLDVRNLALEELSEESFPVSLQEDFRLFISPEVHQGISQHAKTDTSVEICGVLVGLWQQDHQGPYAQVENYIRCDSATSKFAEVTFTHESWAAINEEMDTKYEDKRILGWYHSHPDFGIFLSDRDCFIHEHFFSGPGQVAYVVDPVRDLEGAFAWKEDKPTPMQHYWVGKTIRTVQASVSKPTAEEIRGVDGGHSERSDVVSQADGLMGMPLTSVLLSSLAIFLLGYTIAGWRTSWERQAVIDGVVSNYTNLKQAKLGLREELAESQKYIKATLNEVKQLQLKTEGMTEEQQAEQKKTRMMIVSSLQGIEKRLGSISDRYGYSEEERRALLQYQKQLESQAKKLLEKQQESIKEEQEKAAKEEEQEDNG